mmetsp:Transcript_117937/g.333572  ORF Transcript_117937/g.333572 Transcript_117937/m.333572 type:complete len:253 (+) Transcript_117937:209-967(+)
MVTGAGSGKDSPVEVSPPSPVANLTIVPESWFMASTYLPLGPTKKSRGVCPSVWMCPRTAMRPSSSTSHTTMLSCPLLLPYSVRPSGDSFIAEPFACLTTSRKNGLPERSTSSGRALTRCMELIVRLSTTSIISVSSLITYTTSCADDATQCRGPLPTVRFALAAGRSLPPSATSKQYMVSPPRSGTKTRPWDKQAMWAWEVSWRPALKPPRASSPAAPDAWWSSAESHNGPKEPSASIAMECTRPAPLLPT